MNGTNFCTSAGAAMKVILCNALRFGALHGIGAVVMTFAKLFIVAASICTGYFSLVHFYQLGDEKDEIKEIIGPLLVFLSLTSLDYCCYFLPCCFAVWTYLGDQL
jgi:hypothetical protein